MVYLKLLLILYGSTMLLWSLLLNYYLYHSLVTHRQPEWLRTILRNRGAGELVLYGSVMLSPLFVLFSTILIIKKSFKEVLRK